MTNKPALPQAERPCTKRLCRLVSEHVGTLETTMLQWKARAIAAEAIIVGAQLHARDRNKSCGIMTKPGTSASVTVAGTGQSSATASVP